MLYDLIRHVVAVPGSVLSPISGGCHSLIKKNIASLVSDSNAIKEIVTPLTQETLDYRAINFAQGQDNQTLRSYTYMKSKSHGDDQSYKKEIIARYGFQEDSLDSRIVHFLQRKKAYSLDNIINNLKSEPHAVLEILARLSADNIVIHNQEMPNKGYILA